jgi:cytochrome c peroxidase
VIGGLAVSGALLYITQQKQAEAASPNVDYDAIRKVIAEKMDNIDYDDGSYGPLLIRLAWHCAGTYDKNSKTGGSNGGTMRFSPECNHGANAGLKTARDFLEPIKKQHPGITYADLYTLAGAVAVEELGGPKVAWRPGRVDAKDGHSCPPDGRLPDAAKEQNHVREVFNRMGFSDQEMVALIGAHALGRCHTDRSGYDGPWTFAPTSFSNEYFRLLIEEKWVPRQWKGPKQFEDVKTKKLMMLPADMALVQDPNFKKYVELYAKDGERFKKDFGAAFSKLLELGVKFPSNSWWSRIFGN